MTYSKINLSFQVVYQYNFQTHALPKIEKEMIFFQETWFVYCRSY